MNCRGTLVRSAWISEFYFSNRMDNYMPSTRSCNALGFGVNHIRKMIVSLH
jgi:hypothetical protein